MLVNMNMAVDSEMGLIAATIGQARGEGKEDWGSDSVCHSICLIHKRGRLWRSLMGPLCR